MSHFKFEKFNILAHDRGARVAHRLALDHPENVEKVVLLDIAPTLWMYEHTDMAFVSSIPACLHSPPHNCPLPSDRIALSASNTAPWN